VNCFFGRQSVFLEVGVGGHGVICFESLAKQLTLIRLAAVSLCELSPLSPLDLAESSR
jgi:hypothetical protein